MIGNLTLDQLNAMLTDVIKAIGSPTLSIRRADGSELRYRSMDEALKAKAALEDMIREAQGTNAGRVSLAQHRRGDGPRGPGWPYPGCL